MVRFEMTVRKINGAGGEWTEEYQCEGDPQTYAQNMIDSYNADLRPNEIARELLSVRVLDKKPDIEHQWTKTNGFTLKNNVGYHDTYKCAACGITGKRYGLSETIKRDGKFSASKYTFCNA